MLGHRKLCGEDYLKKERLYGAEGRIHLRVTKAGNNTSEQEFSLKIFANYAFTSRHRKHVQRWKKLNGSPNIVQLKCYEKRST